MNRNRPARLALRALALVVLPVLLSCGGDSPAGPLVGEAPAASRDLVAPVGPVPLLGSGDGAHVAPVVTGGGRQIAELTLVLEGDEVTATVSASGALRDVQLHAAAALGGIPQTRSGNPIPGQFGWRTPAAQDAGELSIVLDVAELGLSPGDLLYLAAHVSLADGQAGWAAGLPFPGASRATYLAAALNRDPAASFTASVSSADPLTVTLDASASSDPDGQPLAYRWSFGDGSEPATGATITHRYATGGAYTVALIVEDGAGGRAATTQTVRVNRAPLAAFTSATVTPPFGWSFDASGSSDPDGDALTFSWSFGDGSPSAAGAVAAHTFAAPGTYTVTLTATDPAGASSQHAAQVQVQDPARPDLVITSCVISPASPRRDQTVTFTVTIANQGTAPAVFPTGYHGVAMTEGAGGYDMMGGTSLAAGATVTNTFTWLPYSHAAGDWAPTVTIDPDNRVIERNEENNGYACPTFTLAPAAVVADLVITSVVPTVSPLTTASDFAFRITVKNQGTAAATISYPMVIVESAQSYFVYPPQAVWTLAPGASQTFDAPPNWGYIQLGTWDWVFRIDPYGQVPESDETNNAFTLRATVTEPPADPNAADLVLTSCVVTPAAPRADQTVQFQVTVLNQGNTTALFPAGYHGIAMTNGGSYSSGLLGGTTIAPGASQAVVVQWPPSTHTAGSWTPTITIDPENRIVETDDANNSIDCAVTLTPQVDFADLVITNVETTVTPLTTATDFKFRITVKNQGTASATISYPMLIVESAYSYFVYPPQQVWTLAPGASQTFEAPPNWGYIQVGTWDWTFTVDPYRQVFESDDTNNTFTLRATVTAP